MSIGTNILRTVVVRIILHRVVRGDNDGDNAGIKIKRYLEQRADQTRLQYEAELVPRDFPLFGSLSHVSRGSSSTMPSRWKQQHQEFSRRSNLICL
jgi:hypothetical protein